MEETLAHAPHLALTRPPGTQLPRAPAPKLASAQAPTPELAAAQASAPKLAVAKAPAPEVAVAHAPAPKLAVLPMPSITANRTEARTRQHVSSMFASDIFDQWTKPQCQECMSRIIYTGRQKQTRKFNSPAIGETCKVRR